MSIAKVQYSVYCSFGVDQCTNNFAVIVLLIFLWIVAVDGEVTRNKDICGPNNGRRLYLELGESGVLHARNVTFEKTSSGQQSSSRIQGTTNSSHEQCSLELVTCPSCVISLIFKSISLHQHCRDSGIMMDSPCRFRQFCCCFIFELKKLMEVTSAKMQCDSSNNIIICHIAIFVQM